MSKTLDKLESLIQEGELFLGKRLTCDDCAFQSWNNAVIRFLEKNLGKDSTTTKIFKERDYTIHVYFGQDHSSYVKAFEEDLRTSLNDLKRILVELQEDDMDSSKHMSIDSVGTILHILNRFHLVTKQLRNRYDSRETLDISDEYDVQDLLHSLLYLYFDDIRPEEWTPSYAGKCARQDFLLKDDNIVIEVKKTRKGLSTKEIGDQLINDIARYQSHPNCKTLICFVYDPEERISNPIGIEKDLTKKHNDLDVIVRIIQR